MLARILLNRLNANILEVNVPEEQCEFRASRRTIDLVFAARQLQEKCRELNQLLYALFVDFTKPFDSVSREALWTVLGKFGCPGKFVRLLHVGMKPKVQSCGSPSDEFDIVTAVKQDCVLAPALFSLYLTAMTTHNTNDSILHRPSRSINRVALSAAYSRWEPHNAKQTAVHDTVSTLRLERMQTQTTLNENARNAAIHQTH
ncbi:uncharacterized protein DEA37_0012357 [Paragonimus westermani]|uniref:Reverse transcriptase domain-containing protein n=1 Tax=Paragonimus westermani TaxID=34504 RepID=A0A5J4NAK3_9TREM|nr:uncharacterized protein DEA37_0012357 [Paragonimus westermani]